MREATNKVRSAFGTFIFLCVGALICYKIYPDVYLTYLVYFDHSKNYHVVIPNPLDWAFCALFVDAILVTLVRKWRWSTIPLWSLVLLTVGIVFVVNPETSIDAGELLMFLVLPIPIQVAVLLRRDYKIDPAT